MICSQCGTEISVAQGECPSCHTPIPTPGQTTLVSAEIDLTMNVSPMTVAPGGAATGDAETIGNRRQVARRSNELGLLGRGQQFGSRYQIISLLGIGGMGEVYRAWDAELGMGVALKIVRPEVTSDPGSAARLERQFKSELVLARQVTHKHVVRIHDLGDINGIKYITMPYVEGDDLATVIKREGSLDVARSLKLARQIVAGLEAAHDAKVVHRDLKPANIMVSAAGEALIMDFGIARSASGPTAAGVVVGTLEYMAPEQARAGVVDHRADIYAVGLILYETLAGRRRSSGSGTALEDMKARLENGVPPLQSVNPDIPDTVAAIVAKCLEQDPSSRYQSSAELGADLNRLDDDGALIPEPQRVTRPLMVTALIVLIGIAAGTYVVGRRAVPTAPRQHEPMPALIADFDNRTGDPAFDGPVEQTLALALEGAPYITVFKTKDARAIAAELSPAKATRITPEMGQLIARREGLKVLVGGAIDKQGTGYRVELRAVDPANGKPITTTSQNVRDKAQVLNSVASMATKIREALGESKTEMAKLAAAETVTAGSLEAMGAFVHAQELQQASKFQDALQEYQRAVALDPQFGRAYAGIASVYANFKQPDKAESAYQAAIKLLNRMTEREKYRTLGTYYLNVAQNYEKAIENYETLVRLYPADDGGHGNLALAFTKSGNLPRAVTEVRKALDIYPRNSLQRYNYAMYSMYTGDFSTAITEATTLRKENPSFEYFFLPLAISRLAQGDTAGARDTYAQLSRVSALGASFATLGEADADLYFGRNRHAIGLLREGMTADAKNKSSSQMARKSVARAEAYLALGQRKLAADAAIEASQLDRAESTLIPAARVLLRAGQQEKALQIAADLEKLLQRGSTSYARLIAGEVALENGRFQEAIEAFRDAQKRSDSWFGRFLLGKAYVAAGGHFPEALAELELAAKRAGETTDVFIDDMSTLRYLPPAYYWLARAQEGSGVIAPARLNYERFLKLRTEADPPDPLATDATRRLQDLR